MPNFVARMTSVAAGGEHAREQALVVAAAVAHRRVEQGDAGIERALQCGERFGVVGRAVDRGHAPATEAER
jgi:hypothetical protein